MASAYQDIIRIRGGRAAYNLESEGDKEWASFIPNAQFDSVLQKVLKSVRNNDIDLHKSFWLNGTYGTGKSHAVAVISHLLGDSMECIKPWVELEYAGEKYESQRQAILSLREHKRLLTVKLYGIESMTHPADLALVLQQTVLTSLRKKNMELHVPSDFERCIEHISTHQGIWQPLIDSHPQLSAVAPNIEQLVNLLNQGDVGTYHHVVDALRYSGLGTLRQDNAKLKDWMIEVQDKLVEQGEYTGLLIVWDEFTDVMRDPMGVQVLKALQEVADTLMSENNNSYLFLISHPSAFDTIGAEQLKQTNGRYHVMKYNMEPASAFRIMSRKFEISDRARHEKMRNAFYQINQGLLQIFNQYSINQNASDEDLRSLFPLHPGTANLATHYATVVGAATRGVFEFLAQNDDIRHFLSDPDKFQNCDTITADYLWDYILKDLQTDVTHYGAVTERYNSYLHRVKNKGVAYFAIFKSLLLLNAFNNVSGSSNYGLITPSAENIRNLYRGTRYAVQMDSVLQWLNDESIIQRAPGGMYSVQFSALPPIEIENKKTEMRSSAHFLRTYAIANFGAGTLFEKRFLPNTQRPFEYAYFSDEENDAILRNRIKKRRKQAKEHSLFFALLLSRNNEELAKLSTFAEACAKDTDDKDLRNIIFIVFNEVFSEIKYDQFIEYMANKACAESRGLADQSKSHNDNAQNMVKEWLDSVYRNNATIYINGVEKQPIAVRKLPTIVKDIIVPMIYSSAPEAHALLRTKAPMPFWKTQNSKGMVRTMLFAKSFGEILEMNSNMRYIQHLLQDCLDENLEWKVDIPIDHPLKKVCNVVSAIIERADKSQTFNYDEKFDLLTKPPYGFYPNFANMAMMAFAMRPWVKKIFDMQGKPRDENAMVDDIELLFKVWDGTKKAGGKLSFKFQTPEEGKLCREITSLFSLESRTKDYGDISSLTNAKYVIVNHYLNGKKTPLWALKYVPSNLLASTQTQAKITASIKRLVDNIVTICSERELRNPALVNETLKLIDEQRMDVMNILNVENVFIAGFHHFLLNLPIVNIQEDELEEVMEYIQGHSESSVGYWTEQAVIDHAKDWRLKKVSQTPPIEPPSNGDADIISGDDSVEHGTSSQNDETDKLEEMREKARKRIEQIQTLEEAKELLFNLCKDGTESFLAKIVQ